MDDIADAAGAVATAVFALGYLPMIARALRTRDLTSYSRANLVLTNTGNALQTCYVVLNLPLGPIWLLNGVNVAVWALMLGLHLRHGSPRPDDELCRASTVNKSIDERPKDPRVV